MSHEHPVWRWSPGVPDWLVNVLAFQVGWWAVVLTAARGRPGLGVAVVCVLVGWHVLRSRPARSELALVVVTAVIGLVVESFLQASGWVSYAGGGLAPWLAPGWMVALWANFAMTLNVSMRPLHGRSALAALLGALGGPAAYLGGARLGAMTFNELAVGLFALAVTWAVLTPLLLGMAGRLSSRVRP